MTHTERLALETELAELNKRMEADWKRRAVIGAMLDDDAYGRTSAGGRFAAQNIEPQPGGGGGGSDGTEEAGK